MPFGISANKKRNGRDKYMLLSRNEAVFLISEVENLRFSPFKFNFCLLFPFSPSDVHKYASRVKNEKFC